MNRRRSEIPERLCDHHATVVASLASLPHLDEADTARVRADLERQCPECGRARRLASRSGGRSDEQTPEVPQEVPEAPRALEAVFVPLGHALREAFLLLQGAAQLAGRQADYHLAGPGGTDD